MSFLKINNLSVDYKMRRETVYAAKNINIEVKKGEILGLVGESGSGKTTLSNLILKLDAPSSGDILYRGKSVYNFNKNDLLAFRQKVQVVFQDPYASLNHYE